MPLEGNCNAWEENLISMRSKLFCFVLTLRKFGVCQRISPTKFRTNQYKIENFGFPDFPNHRG